MHKPSLPKAIEASFAKIIPGKTVVTVQHQAEGPSLHLALRMRQRFSLMFLAISNFCHYVSSKEV